MSIMIDILFSRPLSCVETRWYVDTNHLHRLHIIIQTFISNVADTKLFFWIPFAHTDPHPLAEFKKNTYNIFKNLMQKAFS